MSITGLTEFYINDAIKRLCEGSQIVDNFNIELEDNTVIAVFKAKDGIKMAQLTKEEIQNRIETENIQNDQIKDFIINLIREKLIRSIVIESTENIRKNVENGIAINQTVSNILDKLFPNK